MADQPSERSDPERLTTQRLTLTRPRSDDVDAVFALHHEPRAVAHNPSDALADGDEAAALLARWDEHWRRYGFGYWMVRRAHDDGTPIGICGIKRMELGGRTVLNLLYRFAPSVWGQGFAGKAAAAVVAWAGARYPATPLIARVRPENTASHQVASRIGLVRAPHLDGPGYDGPDQIYVSFWPAASS
ncbi:MAG TPA: GNAT family N-acetyltransferase [Jiangellaceae bacterium]